MLDEATDRDLQIEEFLSLWAGIWNQAPLHEQ